jgi:hypothetical protein
MWPGPLPIGHCHHDATKTVLGSAELAKHVAYYHLSAAAPEDWHIHWVFPSMEYFGVNGEAVAVAADEPNAAAVSLQATLPPSQSIRFVEITLESNPPPLVTSRTFGSFQIVGLLASRRSLPELFGIMLC